MVVAVQVRYLSIVCVVVAISVWAPTIDSGPLWMGSTRASAQTPGVIDPCNFVDAKYKDFFCPPQTPSPPSPGTAEPRSAPAMPEWRSGWIKSDVTVTLRAGSDDATRGALGVSIAVPAGLAMLPVPGVLVVRVDSGGAALGVVQRGDIVAGINGQPVGAAARLSALVGRNPPGAQVKLELWRRPGGYAEWREAVSRQAKANDAAANYLLGFLEQSFESADGNSERAFAHYSRAANLGSLEGIEAVADAHYFGRGAKSDLAEAVSWYRRAADLGSPSAMFRLGDILASGRAGQSDPGQSFQLMQRAARTGHVNALYNLASYYDTGYGTARDAQTAARTLIEAVRKGDNQIVIRFSSETRWTRTPEFMSALQRQLQEAMVYSGPVDGKINPQMMLAFVRLQLGSAP